MRELQTPSWFSLLLVHEKALQQGTLSLARGITVSLETYIQVLYYFEQREFSVWFYKLFTNKNLKRVPSNGINQPLLRYL